MSHITLRYGQTTCCLELEIQLGTLFNMTGQME
jgi:hypothetical protein